MNELLEVAGLEQVAGDLAGDLLGVVAKLGGRFRLSHRVASPWTSDHAATPVRSWSGPGSGPPASEPYSSPRDAWRARDTSGSSGRYSSGWNITSKWARWVTAKRT